MKFAIITYANSLIHAIASSRCDGAYLFLQLRTWIFEAAETR
jgi:hypothetical protein